jgi:hypothetical protein
MNSKFLIGEISPLTSPRSGCVVRGKSVIKIHDWSRDGEDHDAFARRYLNEPTPAPPEPKPVAPTIEPIEAKQKYNKKAVEAADAVKPAWLDLFRPEILELTAYEAYRDCFADDDLVLLTSGSITIVESFSKLQSLMPSGVSQIACNPVCSARCRAPRTRQNIIVSFPYPIDLRQQLSRGLYLDRLLTLELSVFVPSRLTVEHWYRAKGASSKAIMKFAEVALSIGAAPGTFSSNFIARLPSALDSGPSVLAAKLMLDSIGLTNQAARSHLVLFKAKKSK